MSSLLAQELFPPDNTIGKQFPQEKDNNIILVHYI